MIFPVIVTRNRHEWMLQQIEALVPQLEGTDRIIIYDDASDSSETHHNDKVIELYGQEQLGPDKGRRLANALVPTNGVVVEIDDHDIAEPNLLHRLRETFKDPEALFAYCDVWLSDPKRTTRIEKEKLQVENGASFSMDGFLGYGLRSYRKWAYDAIGGYPLQWFPVNDYVMACMFEQAFGMNRVRHLKEFLVTVTQDVTGITVSKQDELEKKFFEVQDIARNAGFDLPYSSLVLEKQKEKSVSSRKLIASKPVEISTKDSEILYRPRVLAIVDARGSGLGGGQLSLVANLSALADAGWDTTLCWVGCDADAKPAVLPDNVHFIRCQSDSVADITATIQENFPDLILCGGMKAQWKTVTEFNIPVLGLLSFWRPFIKFADDEAWDALDSGDPEEIKKFVDPEGLDLIQKSEALVYNSKVVKKCVESLIGKGHDSTVVRPVINTDVVNRQTMDGANNPLKERKMIILPSGQPGKGVKQFIKLAETNPDFEFIILAGDTGGVYDVVPKNLIIRKDWLEPHEMQVVYQHARLMFIGTKTCETYSRAGIEARALGIPLLVTECGNLPNIAADGHGIVISKKATDAEVQEGFENALKLEPASEIKLMEVDDRQALVRLAREYKLWPNVFYPIVNSAGAGRAGKELQKVLGVKTGRVEEIDRAADLLIIPSMWGEFEKQVVARWGKRFAIHWHSHVTQMDTHRHELTAWNEIIGDGVQLLMSCETDVDSFKRAGLNIMWMPEVYEVPDLRDVKKKEAIFIPGPYGLRKNIFASMLAVRAAGLKAHVSSWIRRDALMALDFAKTIGLELVEHDIEGVEDFRQVAAKCQAAICLSQAETFCYSLADCVAVGTPIITGTEIPFLQTSDILDSSNVAEATESITYTLKNADATAKQQRKELVTTARKHRKQASRTLWRLLS